VSLSAGVWGKLTDDRWAALLALPAPLRVDLRASWRGLVRGYGVGHLGRGRRCRNLSERGASVVQVLQ